MYGLGKGVKIAAIYTNLDSSKAFLLQNVLFKALLNDPVV